MNDLHKGSFYRSYSKIKHGVFLKQLDRHVLIFVCVPRPYFVRNIYLDICSSFGCDFLLQSSTYFIF